MFYFIYRFNDELDLKEIQSKMALIPTNHFHNSNESLSLCAEDLRKIQGKYQNYKFTGQDEMNGYINIFNKSNENECPPSEIPFKIRFKSRFIFIKTDFQFKKVKTAQYLNKILNKELMRFIPFYEDEKKFICNIAAKHEIKFFFDGDIINDENIEKKYCRKELNEDYSLFEAYLELKSDHKKIPVYYYGDAMQFPPRVNNEDIEYVIQAFENAMTEN